MPPNLSYSGLVEADDTYIRTMILHRCQMLVLSYSNIPQVINNNNTAVLMYVQPDMFYTERAVVIHSYIALAIYALSLVLTD